MTSKTFAAGFSQATHDGCVFRESGIVDIDGDFQNSHSGAHS